MALLILNIKLKTRSATRDKEGDEKGSTNQKDLTILNCV